MKGTIPLGRYAGIPVRAHLSVLILIIGAAVQLAVGVLPGLTAASTLAYWLTAGIFAVLFAGSVLAHELAHAALARRFGVRVETITLWMFGGATKFADEPTTPGRAAAIAGIGPAVTCGLGIVFYALAFGLGSLGLSGLLVAGLVWLAVVNLFLAGLNLLPGAPLDGGRLLHAWLWHRSGDRTRATMTTAKIGQGIGGVFCGLGAGLLVSYSVGDGLLLTVLGMVLTAAATAERAAVSTPVRDDPVGRAMPASPVIAPSWWTVQAFVDYLGANAVLYLQYPVRDGQGTQLGVVTRDDLFGIEPSQRTAVHIQDITRPLDARVPARPQNPQTTVLHHPPQHGDGPHRAEKAGVSTSVPGSRTPPFRFGLWYFVITILSFGVFAWMPFLYAAMLLHRRSIAVWAAIYGAAAVIITAPLWLPLDTETSTGTVIITVWGLSMVTTVIVGCVQQIALRREVYRALSGEGIAPDPALAAALHARARRDTARQLTAGDPLIARDLHVGRPDLPRTYDDGGLVDLNSAPAAVIADICQLSPETAATIVTARTARGGFRAVDDVLAAIEIPTGASDAIREHGVVIPSLN
jgi:Zn-dependent protease/DNA uptake protein ComE-like DNA-binding protein